jgi:YebC/PmpR family DNA-binding regulatory protein
MSGHNKWSQIQRQKGKTDAAKSQVFGKLAKQITDEAKKAGGNLSSPGLKAAIEKAKAVNMPSDNIERAIKKATSASTEVMESITYEAYGPGGCGIIIEALTSNRNKAAQEIKHVFAKNGFSLAGIGSVTWAFEKKQGEGWVATTPVELSEDDSKLLETIITDLENSEEVQDVYTNAT